MEGKRCGYLCSPCQGVLTIIKESLSQLLQGGLTNCQTVRTLFGRQAFTPAGIIIRLQSFFFSQEEIPGEIPFPWCESSDSQRERINVSLWDMR